MNPEVIRITMARAENDLPGSEEPVAEPRLVTRAQSHLFAFLRELHSGGLSVPPNKQLDFFTGIEALGPSTSGQLYWLGVATLVTSERGQAIYDEVFQQFFGGTQDATVVADEPADEAEDAEEEPEEEEATGSGENDVSDAILAESGGSGLRASLLSPEGSRRFASTTAAAASYMARIRTELPSALPTVRSRRRRSGTRRQQVDLRATHLDARSTYGEIVKLRWLHRPNYQRRLLILVDVSGSMKQYSPDYLRFAHAAVASCARVEVFTFGTRLTRVTSTLRIREVDSALAALAQVVLDADGGTLIGESLQEFLGNARLVTMARGAQVLILSDGLERGDCTSMVSSVRRLSQLAHRLSWWSPLACDPNYRPLTRGMSAIAGELDAIAGVDDLPSSLASIREQFAAPHQQFDRGEMTHV